MSRKEPDATVHYFLYLGFLLTPPALLGKLQFTYLAWENKAVVLCVITKVFAMYRVYREMGLLEKFYAPAEKDEWSCPDGRIEIFKEN